MCVDIKTIIKENYKQLCDKSIIYIKQAIFLKATKLAQGETDYQNSPISIREIE